MFTWLGLISWCLVVVSLVSRLIIGWFRACLLLYWFDVYIYVREWLPCVGCIAFAWVWIGVVVWLCDLGVCLGLC